MTGTHARVLEALAALGRLLGAPSAALATLAALAPAVAAQTVRFEPQRHLDGYAEARLSEWHELYRFAEFETLDGRVIPNERLAELRQSWNRERERVAARIEHFRSVPRDFVLYRLERAMLEHPYFSRIQTETFATHDPFVFLLQPPRTSREGYEDELVGSLGDSLLELLALFRAEVTRPLGLEASASAAAFPVIVLGDRQEYARYVRTLPEPALFFAQANYDPGLKAVVAWLGPEARPASDPSERRPVLHEAVLALLDAHDAEERRPEPWIEEGLAGWLSGRVLAAEDEPGRPADPIALKALVESVGEPEGRAACLLDLDELCGVRTYAQLYEHVLRKASAQGVAQPDYAQALLAYFGQAVAWVHWLEEGEGGELQGAFRTYLGRSLADEGGADAIRRALGDRTLEEVNRGFRTWLSESLEDWREAVRRDEADLDVTFRLEDVTQASMRREAEERVDTLEALAPVRSEPAVRFAAALADARAGRFAAAAQEVRVALAYDDGTELGERMRRELERLDGFRDERRRFLEHLLESGDKLNLMMDEGRLLAPVLAVEEERVVLGENRLGVDSLALDEIDPIQLVKLMRTAKYRFDQSWVHVYPHVLRDTEDWPRLLEDETTAGALALREDVESGELGDWLRLSEAVDILQGLSEGGLPETVEEARPVMESLRRLSTEFGDLELVQVRRPAMVRMAYRAQALLFEEEGLAEVIHGALEPLGDGRYRITYGFDDPAQGEDFADVRYLPGYRWKGSPDPEDSTPFHVEDGVFVTRGATCARHVLEFEGPQTVRMRYVFRTPQGPFDNRIKAMIGLCDDGAGSFVGCDMIGGLTVSDVARSYLQETPSAMQVFMDTEHVVEVNHDGGETVRTTFDGQPAAESPCGPRLTGNVFLWANSECPFEVVELVVEGRVAPASVRTLRAEWVDARLEELGLR